MESSNYISTLVQQDSLTSSTYARKGFDPVKKRRNSPTPLTVFLNPLITSIQIMKLRITWCRVTILTGLSMMAVFITLVLKMQIAGEAWILPGYLLKRAVKSFLVFWGV